MHLRTWSALAAIGSIGCVPLVMGSRTLEPTRLYDLRVRLPLEPELNQRCERHCDETRREGTTGYVECVARCAGSEVTDGKHCAPEDHRPRAVCYEVRARVVPDDDGLLASLIVDSVLGGTAAVIDAISDANRK